jgi:hypothetical protein
LGEESASGAEIAKALRVSVMTIHRWRKMREREFPYSRVEDACVLQQSVIGNQSSEAKALSRIAQLQLENARLRKLVTDLPLEKMRMEDGQAPLRIDGRKRKSANKRDSFRA